MSTVDAEGQEAVVYLTDLGRCQPQDAFSPAPRRHHWQTLPYEAGPLKGTMLIANEETAAPDITLPFNITGWYAISIGLFAASEEWTKVMLKLTDDPCYSAISLPAGWDKSSEYGSHKHQISEFHWKTADLTGQQLHLRQDTTRIAPGDEPGSFRCIKSKIAFIKLVPLSGEEVQRLQADRQRKDTKRLYAHNDAHGYLFKNGAVTPDEVYSELEPYRDTDFSRIYWEFGAGDLLFHLGKAGRLPTCDDVDDFSYRGDRLYAEAWRAFRETGVDPFTLALDYAHQIGMEFHAGYRPAGFFFPTGLHLEQWNTGGFYEQHPELRFITREGTVAPRIAYTFPETRQYVISLFREIAQHPIDGICVIYVRRPPLVGYEPPLVEGFIREFGEDPRQLDEEEPRWLDYRCRILTEFMAELRQEMIAVAREQGRAKPIEITAMVSAREEENILHGMKVTDWIARGLVDTIIPYTMAPNLNSAMESWPDVKDAAYWVELTKGTSCKLSLSVLPRWKSPEDYRRKAAQLYGEGAESLFFWDSAGPDSRVNHSPSGNTMCRLGHRDEIEAWMKAGESSLHRPGFSLGLLGTYDLSFATPG